MEKEFDCWTVPLPSDAPYEYWEKENRTGRGLVSMKHAAVNCGLGSIGKSTLLLNEQFGNRLNIGIVLTDLALQPDDFAKEVCIPNCRKCIESCPAHAINENGVNQKLCRLNTYGKNERGFETVDCNKCRSVCPSALGNRVFVAVLSKHKGKNIVKLWKN